MVELDPPARPDTKIKIYLDPQSESEELATHKELASFNGLTLKLVEDVAGNVFNRPFPFVAFRTVAEKEVIPTDLYDDDDPLEDYFLTIRSLGKQTDSQCGFVLMGYKTLEDESGLGGPLDASWPEWTGTEELAKTLGRDYDIERVHCWKAPNAKQDHFKYLVMIEIAGGDMLRAKDALQRFRIRKMTGYVALYMLWDRDREMAKRRAAETAVLGIGDGSSTGARPRGKAHELKSQESIGAIIHNMSQEMN